MSRIIYLFFIIILMACQPIKKTSEQNVKSEKYNFNNVQIIGGGFVDGIIFHPAEKDLRYARTDMGGAYRWDKEIEKWLPLLDWVSYDDYNLVGVESIALDPNDPDMLYMACGTYTRPSFGYGAILISANRGESFKVVDVPIKFGGNENGRGNGERMVVDPNDSNVLYLGTRRSGMWKSTDKGLSWVRLEGFPNVTDTAELDDKNRYWRGGSGINVVVIDPNSGSENTASSDIYVTVSLMNRDNFFVSRDAGKTWDPVEDHYKKNRPTQATLASNGIFYITYGSNPGPWTMVDGAVWKYNINDESWSDITPDKPDSKCKFGYAAVTVDQNNPNSVLVTSYHRYCNPQGDDIFKSNDGGETWSEIFKSGSKFDYSISPYVQHTPVHWMFDVEIDPFDANHVIFTTGYGGHETFNFKDTDKGDTIIWQIMSRGIEETVALELLSPLSGPQLYTAIGDYCGFAHYDLNESNPNGCYTNPHFSNTNGIACAELNPNIIVRVGQGSHHIQRSQNIGFSFDEGKTWNPCSSTPETNSHCGHISVTANGKSWIWTPENQKPYLTEDNGNSWVEIYDLPTGIRVIADRVNPNIFYASDIYNGRLYVSVDGGHSFIIKNLLLPQGNPKVGYFRGDDRGGQDRIYSTPGLEGELWFAAFDGLMQSKDYGDHFDMIGNIEEIHAFGFGKAKTNNGYPSLFLVGRINNVFGFYRSDDEAKTWIRINDDQHQYGLVLHITGDPKKYGRVYIGTHGRGIVYGDPID